MHLLQLLAIFATFSCHVLAAALTVNLHANWTDLPFEVQLVEAISSYDEALYILSMKLLFGNENEAGSEWDDDSDDDVEKNEHFALDLMGISPHNQIHTGIGPVTHGNLYSKLVMTLTKTQFGFLNLNLVNSLYSPRIRAHYDHYNTEIGPIFEHKVRKQCAKDSFGEPIADPLAVWVKYGSRIYCSEQDLYALQLDRTSEHLLPFDRPIGSDANAPILVLYGDPSSERFSGILSTLLLLAEAGNLQFVWRYVPPTESAPMELSGYGTTLTVLEKKQALPKANTPYTSLYDFYSQHANSPVHDVPEDRLPQISAKIASLVLDLPPKQRFEELCFILQNLPKYAAHLADLVPPSNFKAVSASARANEQKGASRDLIGLSINGAMVHRLETDLPNIVNKLRDEVKFIEDMELLGFTIAQAKKMFSKFALLSAYKENEYRTGSANNRFTLYQDTFRADDTSSGGVVFFNDLGLDENYNLYSTDRYKVYIEEASQFRHGQIPPLKENVHDIIFVVNFSSKSQLKVFFAMSKMILDKGIPQQLGILPLVETEKDARITQMFYHILEVGELKEALAFLYKYLDAKTEDEEQLFSLVANPGEKSYLQYENTLSKYSITEPSVVINGVIMNMRSTKWQAQMGQQIVHDVKLLQNAIRQGNDKNTPLKEVLYSGSKGFRNLRVTPKDPGNIRYKRITRDLIDASVAFKKDVDLSRASITFWLIGDFNTQVILDQFKQILGFMRQYNGRSTQARVFNTAKNSDILNGLVAEYANQLLTSSMFRKMTKAVGDMRIQTFSEPDPAKVKILERNQIQLHQSSLLFNSRQFRLDTVFSVQELQQIVQYEFPQRLDTIDEILRAYPEDFAYQSITDFKPDLFDDMDWFDLLTSLITMSFNMEDSMVRTDVARFDFSSLNFDNAISLRKYDSNKPLDILIVIDPIDEFSQKLVSMVQSLRDLPFVNIKVLLQPLSLAEGPTALNRFYASAFSPLVPNFDITERFEKASPGVFSNVPESRYRVKVDTPNRWLVVKNESRAGLDMENLELSKEIECVDFVLKGLAVEAFVRDVKTGAAVPGLAIEAKNNKHVTHEGLTMETMGYNQLRLEPGVWLLQVKAGDYDLLSADANRYISNDQKMTSLPLSVFSLAGDLIHVRTRENKALMDHSSRVTSKHADINVFSIASGLNYERLMAIMMLSVKAHTKSLVKFWLLEDFLSNQFRAQLPDLAATYKFEYELISYKWPLWLRQQTEAHRIVWAYKILFLDVLFPADLDKVIFVDADQIARTDLIELVNHDLEGKPYGFTPMCDSREDMQAFRFWDQGYWKTVLKDDLKYHISALFVVDLNVFRENAVGDKLRSHYQKLSSDPNSLSNLDQDLPNNMQRQVPIHSLPQEWLWCETWCSQALKKDAKMIDLCNDPASSESKLERAKRLIPEWTTYNQQLQKLGTGKLAIDHDEL
ncbi:UDP-glucose:glycoprotein glucosyltransferase [Metschnikowia aff. pulcherrima]|uniref:UDP-glucose:glycoprotein glucosyltransferase n=1 Tax=Metschnikowia aff. pulcherrima TaxID=2163413 RepID=A0A4P6XU13_9ASCO|nr:UDP-glucose:glycoprotein glucosyltransferase [Metschnikowia aff. pulcherrima]